jgi:hypothetical protein
MRWFAGVLVLAVAGCGGAALAGAQERSTPRVTCAGGGAGAGPVAARDSELGPLTVMFTRRTPGRRRDAFDGRGWKLPATLAAGETATLSVPRRLRGRVGFVYRRRVQARVYERGVRAADRRVTFAACSGEDAPARTGWPGGIVVDRRRCARLRVHLEGEPEPIERRVPLGRRCR